MSFFSFRAGVMAVALGGVSSAVSATSIDTFSQMTGSSGAGLTQTVSFPFGGAVTVGQTFEAAAVGVDSFSFAIFEDTSYNMQAFVMAWDEVTDKAVGPILYASALTSSTSGDVFTAADILENPVLGSVAWERISFDVGALDAAATSLSVGQDYVIFLSTFDGTMNGSEGSQIGANQTTDTIADGRAVFQNVPSDALGDSQVDFFTGHSWGQAGSLFDLDYSVEIVFIPEPTALLTMVAAGSLMLLRRRVV